MHGERIVRPYSLWMMQRARDTYLGLADADHIGGDRFRAFEAPPRVARDGLSVAPGA